MRNKLYVTVRNYTEKLANDKFSGKSYALKFYVSHKLRWKIILQ